MLGLTRASEIAGPPQVPNDYLSYRDVETERKHPIKLYTRVIDRLFIVMRFDAETAKGVLMLLCVPGHVIIRYCYPVPVP